MKDIGGKRKSPDGKELCSRIGNGKRKTSTGTRSQGSDKTSEVDELYSKLDTNPFVHVGYHVA